MPVIDDRGRLFGKLNLIDVITVAVLLGLIPLGYVAFLLFRVPMPIITSIEPTQIRRGDSATLKLRGSGFRPFLVARLGDNESYGFLVQSPTAAEVKVPDIPPGNYDLVLYDQARELVRIPGAVTVIATRVPSAPARWIRPAPPLPPPVMQLRVVGEFIGMSRDEAELIRGGLKLSGPVVERWNDRRRTMTAEVLSVGATKDGVRRLRAGTPTNLNGATITAPAPDEVHVPALIRASCVINPNPAPLLSDCWFGDTILAQTETLVLTEVGEGGVGGRVNQVRFVITEVLSSAGPTMSPSRADVEVEGEFFGLTQDDLRFVEVGSEFEQDEPFTELRMVGEFIGVSRDVAELIRGGLKLSEPVVEQWEWPRRPKMTAEVLSVGATKDGVRRLRVGTPTNLNEATITAPAPNEVNVPALIRASCVINPNPAPLLSDCWFGDTILAQTETLVLTEVGEGGVGGRVNQVRFVITEVLSSAGPTMSPSRADVEVEGEFFGLTQDDLRFVEVGSKFERWKDEPFAEVVALGIPEPDTQGVNIGGESIQAPADGEFAVRAIIRISCVITADEGCLVDGTVLAQNATKPLPLPGRSDQLKFLIGEIRPAHASMESPLDRVDVQVEGEFFGLTQDALRFVQVGAEFRRWIGEPLAEVLLLGTPEPGTQRVRIGSDVLRTPADDELTVRAIVRMSCVIAAANGECFVGDTVLAENATVFLPVPNSSDQVRFLVGEMRPGDAQPVFSSVRTAMATVRVRFLVGQEVLDNMNVGDVDLGGVATLPSDADRAVLMEIGQEQEQLIGILSSDGLLGRNIQVEGPVVSFDGMVRVPVVFMESGWWYGTQSIKIGAGFNFQTVSGAMRGSIVDMVISDEKVGAAR